MQRIDCVPRPAVAAAVTLFVLLDATPGGDVLLPLAPTETAPPDAVVALPRPEATDVPFLLGTAAVPVLTTAPIPAVELV